MSRPLAWLIVATLGMTVTVAVLVSAPGDLDPTFDGDGKVLTDFSDRQDGIQSIAIQPDGKIIAVGSSATPTGSDFAIARYDVNGFLDGSFGFLGRIVSDFGGDEQAKGVVVQSDGKIVVGGTSSGNFLLARYNSDGSPDSTFGSGGVVTTDFGGFDVLEGLAVQPSNGKIVAVGGGITGGLTFVWLLARYNGTNGSLDLTFNGTGKVVTPFTGQAQPLDLVIDGNEKIVVAGLADPTGSNVNFAMVRYNTTGSLDFTFDADGRVMTDFGSHEEAQAVAVQPNGQIVVLGNGGTDNFILARYSATGALDSTFGVNGAVLIDFGGFDVAEDMALDGDKIVAAGYTTQTSDREQFAIARYNSDGSPDTTFGIAGTVLADFRAEGVSDWIAVANAVAIQSDGNIVAAGRGWNGVGGNVDFGLMRFLAAFNTPAGTNVTVAVGDATLTFTHVTQAGDTTITTSPTGPTPPDGFSLGNPFTYFDVITTALFNGSVEVCLSYEGITYDDEALLALMHYEGTSWINVTTTLDMANNVICGSVMSLSPFIVVEPLDVNDPPLADAGSDQTASAGPDCQAQVALDGTGSSDPDGDPLTYAWTGPFGAASGPMPTVTLPLGTHTITLTVTDIHGESASDTFVITVLDTSAPTITPLTANPSVLWPPKHQMVRVILTAIATDNCGGVTCEIVSVTSDEPIQGLGDGDTAPDWEITGALTLRLRAERGATGDGRIYTVTVRCTDAAGNAATTAVTVLVPRTL